jgi:hypothetical protein
MRATQLEQEVVRLLRLRESGSCLAKISEAPNVSARAEKEKKETVKGKNIRDAEVKFTWLKSKKEGSG